MSKTFYKNLYQQSLGIVGGGQLGRMMAYRASLLGFVVRVYSDAANSPASVFANEELVGSYFDAQAINNFAKKNTFTTTEFENISTKNLDSTISPLPSAIFECQNRLREKSLAKSLGIKTPIFAEVLTKDDAVKFFNQNGKFILKTTELGYDGKGQYKILSLKDIEAVEFNAPYIAEQFVDFELEFSVVLTRGEDGLIVFYPSAINQHKNGILDISIVKKDFNLTPAVQRAREYAALIAKTLAYKGTMAVEFFLTKDKSVVFNEIAPRPHNSGHYTMDMCNVCQFENHIRAVCNLPLITPALLFEGKMLNLIGPQSLELLNRYATSSKAKIHLYSKAEVKEGRKLGHINIID